MCCEIGVGTGSVYSSDKYFESEDGAKSECLRRNQVINDGKPKPKIYCFNNGGAPGWYSAVALSEDGECLAQHICSHEAYMPHDLGITSDWKHEIYWKHYPEGFELVWVPTDELNTHEGLNNAIAKSDAKQAQTETQAG
jgi:hypothetical protein